MAENKASGTFDKSALSRIASADELDHYVKVNTPSAWVILAAALLLVGGLIVWAVVATVPVTVKTTGIALDGKGVYCWVDEDTAKKINETGAYARVGDVKSKSVTVGTLPMSYTEVVNYLGSDFVEESIALNEWNYLVSIEFDQSIPYSDYTITFQDSAVHLVPISITVYEANPISIVMGK